jgi:hypothetical protein
MSNFNPIICVDFDGVIHSYTSGWQGIDEINDPPVPGAIEWLMDHLPKVKNAFVRDGKEVVELHEHEGPIVQIYSSRSKEAIGRGAMKSYLIRHGMPPIYALRVLKYPTQKPAAFLTIDDRAICFNGTFPTTDEMLNFKPWNKK